MGHAWDPALCVCACLALASCCLGELLGPYQDVPRGQVNLKEQGQLVRQDEFTIWLGRRKCQRHVFLFEDLILFSKPKRIEGGFDVYIYKRSFKVRAALQIALGQEVALDFSLKVACLLSSGQLSPLAGPPPQLPFLPVVQPRLILCSSFFLADRRHRSDRELWGQRAALRDLVPKTKVERHLHPPGQLSRDQAGLDQRHCQDPVAAGSPQ